MEKVIFAYARYGGKDTFKEDSVQEGISAAQAGNEFGECYPIGVYDPESNAAYMPAGVPLGVSSDFRDERLDDLRELCDLKEGHEFSSVSYFPSFPAY